MFNVNATLDRVLYQQSQIRQDLPQNMLESITQGVTYMLTCTAAHQGTMQSHATIDPRLSVLDSRQQTSGIEENSFILVPT